MGEEGPEKPQLHVHRAGTDPCQAKMSGAVSIGEISHKREVLFCYRLLHEEICTYMSNFFV